jgi:hypothetical protein
MSLWMAIIGIGIGVAVAIAVAIGFCRPTQPIAIPIPTPTDIVFSFLFDIAKYRPAYELIRKRSSRTHSLPIA